MDLANKTNDFKQLSPLAKVPLLKVGGRHILFESAVINEYLDDISEPSLLPKDPLKKANVRAWIEFSGLALEAQWAWLLSDEANLESNQNHYFEKLDYLQQQVCPMPFANGTQFLLLDCALAPLLMRHELVDQLCQRNSLAHWPKLFALQCEYKNMACIIDSVLPDFNKKFERYFKHAGSALLKKKGSHGASI